MTDETRELDVLEASRVLRERRRSWFAQLRAEVFDEGRPYVLTTPVAPHEIFEALDLPFVTDAWYSGLVAAKRQSGYYSDVLEAHGYHRGLSRYTTMPLAVMLDDDEARKPWGGLPHPALVVTTSGEDDARAAAVLAEHAGAPCVTLESPGLQRLHPDWWKLSRWQWEDLDGTDRIDVMVEQLGELIAHAEAIAGRRLDLDRLRELLDRVNRQEECFDEVRRIVCDAPKAPVRMAETMSLVMGLQWRRGHEWALDLARKFRDEVRARAEAEAWVCPHERHRLMWLGTGLWQNLGFFAAFEEDHGAVFVRSNYLAFAPDGYLRYGLADPVRALASRYVTMSEQMHIPGLGSAWALWDARRHRVGGAIGGAKWWGSELIMRDLEAAGIPTLRLDVDPVDTGRWDGERFRRLVGSFIEQRLDGAE